MKVAPVDQRDIDRGVSEHPGGIKSAEPAADDDYAMSHVFGCRRGEATQFRTSRILIRQSHGAKLHGSEKHGASVPAATLRPSQVIS